MLKLGNVGPTRVDTEAQGQSLAEKRAGRKLTGFDQGESLCQRRSYLTAEISKTRGPSGTRPVFLVARTRVPTECEQLKGQFFPCSCILRGERLGHFHRLSGWDFPKHSKCATHCARRLGGAERLLGKAEMT